MKIVDQMIIFLIYFVRYSVFDVDFSVPAKFLKKVFCSNHLLNNGLYVGITQIIPKLILHGIMDIYPCIKFMNIGLSIFQKLNVRCK